jgi:VCBS repeat-containing protein
MGGSDYSNTIEITIPNSPPVAGPDAYATGENTPLVVPVPGVLSNDTDPNGDPLVAVLDSGVSHGLLTLDPNGSFVYTPTLSYIGPDSFTYRANDGIDNSNLATVSLTITGTNTSPVALDDASTTPEDNSVTVNILANDTDADGDPLNISGVTQPANGTAIIQGASVLYTPDLNYFGSDGFSYTISDGRGGTATANVSIDVTPVNDPPVANSDTYTTTQGSSLVINSPGILQNDVDVDGDPLTPILITDVSHGTLTLSPDGSFTYDPVAGFYGIDQFTYLVSDGFGNSNSVTVSINVTPIVSEYRVFMAVLIR